MNQNPGNVDEPVGMTFRTTFLGDVDITMTAMLSSFGVYNRRWMQDEEGNVYYGGITDRSKEALAWCREMYEKGLVILSRVRVTARN